MELHGKYTFFAEGCRGQLARQLEEKYALRKDADPQQYGIGLKELWDIKPEKHKAGLVIHTAGWPLDAQTYGGSFLYHQENNQVAVGYVVGPGLSEPLPLALRGVSSASRRTRRSAASSKAASASPMAPAAITAGGLQSLPKLVFPGGALIGDDAGFLNGLAHQGQPCRDQVRHARRRGGLAPR